MTSSMAAALLTAEITGARMPVSEIVSPQRFSPRELAKTAAMGAKAVKYIGKRLFQIPKSTVRDLKPGHGAVVRTAAGKMGIYRDEEGKFHAVSPRCPHLGCQLSWNPDEKSWDCPCHGSRFDYDGNLLSGPTQIPATGSSADTIDG